MRTLGLRSRLPRLREGWIDDTTWAFPRTGWFVSHVVLIAGMFWLGYLVGRREG